MKPVYRIFTLILGIAACNASKVSVSAPVNVEVKKVGIANDQDDFAYSGTIEESGTIPLSFSIPGNAEKVLVAEGGLWDIMHEQQWSYCALNEPQSERIQRGDLQCIAYRM